MKHFGPSEASAATIRRTRRAPGHRVQSEYSLWTRDPAAEVLPALAELGIGFVSFSPLGNGFLTGTVDTATAFTDGDIRSRVSRTCRTTRIGENAQSTQVALSADERRPRRHRARLGAYANRYDAEHTAHVNR